MAITISKNKQKTDSKRLVAMLLVAFVLSIWVLLKDDAEDSDAIELVDAKHASQAVPANGRVKNITQTSVLSRVEITENGVIPWLKLKRQPLETKVDNVFKVHSWLVVPKVVKVKASPPPPPVAPPAPFVYMGKLEDSPKGTQLFLMNGGKLYTAIKGQKIDAQWRLDSEENDTINLTYLPLNLPQVLSKSAKSIDIAPPVSAEMNL